ncbi:MAG: 30S ribosomal protein S17 [Candidatus Omnitrophica bacterium]|nr:30S ribosomal protein S17 [Candidatus Omnitrophota bacterium]
MISIKSKAKVIVGTVTSDKMDKSVTVEWNTRKRHPIYKKFVRRHVKIKAHDEKNEVRAGDVVKIMETKPISKNKCWKVVEIITKA